MAMYAKSIKIKLYRMRIRKISEVQRGMDMCRIMIAEDELIGRMILKKTLQKRFEDCEIIDVANGRAALEAFRRTPIHIAILDIEMPGIKGIDVAERIRRENKEIQIIFLSAYDKFEYAQRAVAVHAFEYVLKPYSEHDLLHAVERAMPECGDEMEAVRREQEESVEYNSEKQITHGADADIKTKLQEASEDTVTRLGVMVTMVEEFIRRNYRYDISMQDAARAVNYSETYFCKMFKQRYGRSFTAYLTEYRMREAKKMLLQPTVNVREVGEKVGYSDATYFSRVFRKHIGMSPSEYRNAFLKRIQ